MFSKKGILDSRVDRASHVTLIFLPFNPVEITHNLVLLFVRNIRLLP